MQKKISAMMLVLLFVTSILAASVPTFAAVGSLTGIPTKVISDVDTRIQLSGYGWTPGAPFWYQIQPDTTWTVAGPTYSAGWAADDAGAIPAGSYVAVDITANRYLLLSQSSDGVAGVRSLLITVVTYGPTYELKDTAPKFQSGSTITYGTTINVAGEGFTESGTVTVYFDLTVLKTTTADSMGVISDSVKVPEAVKGAHTVWVYDTALGVAGEDTYSQLPPASTPRQAFTSLTMTPSLEADRLSIRGSAGESLVVIGHGFVKDEKILATPAHLKVAGVETTHAEVTVGADGRFSVTATLTAAVFPIPTEGFADIEATATVTGPVSASKAIIVSVPDVFGDERVKLDKEDTKSAEVGADVTVYVIHFPAGASVSVTLGSKDWMTITTDANGAGKLKMAVPETFGNPPAEYAYTVTASYMGLSDTATLNAKARLKLYDTAGKEIKTGTFVLSGSEITVKFFGLKARTYYTIRERYAWTGAWINIVEEGKVTSITKGTLGTITDTPPFQVRSTTDGSIELKYKTAYPDTGTTVPESRVYVEIEGVKEDVYFRAIKGHSIGYATGVNPYAATGSTPVVTLTFSQLIPARRYQVLFDGAVQTLTVGALTGTYFRGDTLVASGASFTVPAAAAGVHTIDVVPYGETFTDTKMQARTRFTFSTAGGTAAIWLSATSRRMGQSIDVYGYNFDASESLTLNVAGTTISKASPFVSPDVGVTPEGYFKVTVSPFDMAGGSYLLYIKRAAGKPQPNNVITVTPRVDSVSEPRPSTQGGIRQAYIGDPVELKIYGLKPNTRYVVLWDGKLQYRFASDPTGYATFSDFKVPTALAGDHTIALALESDPATAISVSWAKSVIRALPGFKLTPNPEAIMGQTVQIEWDISGLGISYDPTYQVYVGVSLDDMPVSYTLGSGGLVAVYGIYTTFVGTVQVPNGDPDALIKVAVGFVIIDSTGGLVDMRSSNPAVFKRISGAGSLIVGVALGEDVAYIKGKVSEIAVSLSALDAKVVEIKDGVALLTTKFGAMNATLQAINAKVIAIDGRVATIATDLGTVKVDVAAIKPVVTSIQGDVATVKTDVGTIKVAVADLKTLATAIQTAATDAKTAASDAKTAIGAMSTPLYAAVILALIAAVAAIASVVQISRKIAG